MIPGVSSARIPPVAEAGASLNYMQLFTVGTPAQLAPCRHRTLKHAKVYFTIKKGMPYGHH
jgi:hypothetical protein